VKVAMMLECTRFYIDVAVVLVTEYAFEMVDDFYHATINDIIIHLFLTGIEYSIVNI
jgi:hypothetical protein